jgi:hypothetical protein
MDEDFGLDIAETLVNIDKAEVLSVFFPTFRKALIIDTRSNADQGPLVKVMPMVASPQERVRAIRRMRPGFPRITNLTVVPWPRYVDSLVALGIWDKLIARLAAAGQQQAVADCQAALQELKKMEKDELASVVKGENYHTIWSARR